jgi:hypothetical protein
VSARNLMVSGLGSFAKRDWGRWMAATISHFMPTLHPPVGATADHKSIIADRLAAISAARVGRLAAAQPTAAAAVATSVSIPLSTVSVDLNFDAFVEVGFRSTGQPASAHLVVDSGNSTLIVPKFEDLAALPNFPADYKVLVDSVVEPWGCPAKIVRGPIEMPTQAGGIFTIANCVFYACTGDNSNNERTANFGTGWISPWPVVGGVTMQAPLSYNITYKYVEFNYAPTTTIFSAASGPTVAEHSYLTLYQNMPAGYKVFEIIRGLYWMSLKPLSLSIANTRTAWPGDVAAAIAMVDTGGGPLFLSDQRGYLYKTAWPEQVNNPTWTSPCSISCQSVKEDVSITLGDAASSFSYRVHTENLPPSVQGLTLVMCKMCYYMMGEQGMNIGGVSALFNYILVDYSLGKVGFKAKAAALV